MSTITSEYVGIEKSPLIMAGKEGGLHNRIYNTSQQCAECAIQKFSFILHSITS